MHTAPMPQSIVYTRQHVPCAYFVVESMCNQFCTRRTPLSACVALSSVFARLRKSPDQEKVSPLQTKERVVVHRKSWRMLIDAAQVMHINQHGTDVPIF